ncbi:LysE family transporter [Flavobacterium branchiophilum]|uniref:Lysine transporter LysE n=1 Tax=Flavobacterium branchiophilum (strain FL-15) TaxID=1034807 RepID=G2Z4C7_FLABF|nr:LysE family transporter [Flavobacterium branchiophilum]CCB68402.1 Probable transmembrane protein of unknown function. Putative amino-acid efflux protein [Flavobacterium branchiophilum FL-15]
MKEIIPFLSGFISACIGIALPGLINMTAAKVSLKDGKDRAISFVSGALIVIVMQTLLAVLFAHYIYNRPHVIYVLRTIGMVIFSLLTIYFLGIAKKPMAKKENIKIKSKKSRFFLGMLLSALNFFPIPYYVLIATTLSSYHYFTFNDVSILLFLLGVALGSFLVFYIYILFFKKIESKTDFFFKNMNTIIGSVTGIVTLITIYKMF